MKNWLIRHVLLCGAAVLALAAAGGGSPAATYRHHGGVLLNDLSMTPGAFRTTDVDAVCHGGSTKQYRHTTSAMKREVCAEYGYLPGQCPKQGAMEIDHLISLELGGADDARNLWPQPAEPRPGFHEKDKLENLLHRMVCEGRISLPEAQREIANDWYAAYLKYVDGGK